MALHGLYSTHHEVAAFLEPFFSKRKGYRRIYPDLPGMGDSVVPSELGDSGNVVDVIDRFANSVVGTESLLLIGHSYGGYLARALRDRRPEQVVGLALLCPQMRLGEFVGEHGPIVATEDLANILSTEQESEFRGYFVIQTAAMADRFKEAVVPSLGRFDPDAIERLDWRAGFGDGSGEQTDVPTLILTGRRDGVVGYRDQFGLLDQYRRATFVTLDPAGHALAHEQPEITQMLLANWLDGVEANSR